MDWRRWLAGAITSTAVLALAATAVATPVNSAPPSIEGEAFEGRVLEDFPPGSWSGSGTVFVAFQWLRCNASGGACVPIEGATHRRYTLSHADAGGTVRVQETAHDSEGTAAPVQSAQTAVVVAAETAELDVTFSIASTPNAFGEDVLSIVNHASECLTPYFQGYVKGEPFASVGGTELAPGESLSVELPPELEGEPALMEFFRCGQGNGHPARELVPFTFARGYPGAPVEPEPKSEPPPSKTITTPPPTGGPSGPTPGSGSGAPIVTAAQLSAFLGRLRPSGAAAKIGALLKHGGLSQPVTAPEAGTLSVQWYFVPTGAHLASKHKTPVQVASGKLSFASAGTGSIRIRLTAAGKQLLRRDKRVSLTAKLSFVPSGGSAVSAKVGLALRR